MDSFFSLFDPSDGNQSKTNNKKRNKPEQDSVKKKTEAPTKGRRRGRRSVDKNETLPEESSFLCEPGLEEALPGNDSSYIETHIALRSRQDSTTDVDKKPKRRNSGRKNRRKKSSNKISPAKDVVTNAWDEDSNTELDREGNSNNVTSWNNQSVLRKVCDENIGKNVNNLKSNMADSTEPIYNVIDELEKVSIKDDMFLAGDFNLEDLESDFFYNSDDMDECFDDTDSEDSDSSASAYGSLPPEPRFGNVEYKLQLVRPCEKRFQHLVTQLKWRLRSGGGSAIYVVGVRDCGALVGLRPRALRASVSTLGRMAAALRARVSHMAVRRVPGNPHRCVAEIYVRKLADTEQSVELRIAVMGANEAGKSTLIGVLTQGELDNGRGSARLNMFRHQHEVRSGRTSSLSHEILGFDSQGNVVNYGCSELMTAERIGERSAKLVSFLDLAGHYKYQRTTLHGLSGYCPHYAMIVISATAGITHITEEHLGLILALELPFFAVVTKTELSQASALGALLATLTELLRPHGKKPQLITDENFSINCVSPQKSILDSIDGGSEQDEVCAVAVFCVSCVAGAGLRALHRYLVALAPPPAGHGALALTDTDDGSCEFQIDEIFHVGSCGGGAVVGGLLATGTLREGDRLRLGPLETGEFTPITVKSIYRNRVPHGSVRAGQSASLGLGPTTASLRPGMVLLRTPRTGETRARPVFPAPCKRAHCNATKQVADLLRNTQTSLENTKNRKNIRRKNKNLLQDLAKVEDSLKKQSEIEQTNIYKSESDSDDLLSYKTDKDVKDKVLNVKETEDGDLYECGGDGDIDKEECTCDETVPLDDPDDPRGCVYFQATVRVLRHATVISTGFQCTVHVGNVRQTAIIEGILSRGGCLRAGEAGSLVFRLSRCPEYLRPGRRLLLTAGLGTRAIGRVTQTFPYFL